MRPFTLRFTPPTGPAIDVTSSAPQTQPAAVVLPEPLVFQAGDVWTMQVIGAWIPKYGTGRRFIQLRYLYEVEP